MDIDALFEGHVFCAIVIDTMFTMRVEITLLPAQKSVFGRDPGAEKSEEGGGCDNYIHKQLCFLFIYNLAKSVLGLGFSLTILKHIFYII